jgi:NAD(P)-dependent dehydrogenase (short-subunit alcohol dehydrogenase family)
MALLDAFSLEGKSALVTGAASGLGLAYAEALAEAGAAVTLADLDGARAEAEARRLASLGRDVRSAGVDVRDREGLRAAFDAHRAACGGVDAVFCNAGIDSGEGFLDVSGRRNGRGQIDVLSPEVWDRTIAVNLTGVFNTIREAVRLMKQGGRGGSIVVTSSNAAFVTAPMAGTAYMPSKAGVSHLVRGVALELAEYGIRVNAIAPGPFVTEIGGGGVKTDPAVRAAWSALIPLGEMAMPDRIKPLAVFLASEASSYMTGSQVVIDGGMSLGRPPSPGP